MKSKIKPSVILAFGEDSNDSQALKEVALALNPALPYIKILSRPIVLRRPTSTTKLKKRSLEIAQLAAAARVRANVVAIIIHRDLDSIETRQSTSDESPSEQLMLEDYKALEEENTTLILAMPAWEMEAWWLMWPKQVAKYRPMWAPLKDRKTQRVDLIPNAKEVFKNETKPDNPRRVPVYTERDSPGIAEVIRRDNVIRRPSGRSIAFECFIKKIDDLATNIGI